MKYHMARLVSPKGHVSPLCADSPRKVNLKRECWTIRPEAVTCKKCIARMAESTGDVFDPPLDPEIVDAVLALRKHGVDTFESCQGGEGHAYPEPTVRFHGDASEGCRALAAAMKERLPVAELRRVWPIQDEEPTGPWWEITFVNVRTT